MASLWAISASYLDLQRCAAWQPINDLSERLELSQMMYYSGGIACRIKFAAAAAAGRVSSGFVRSVCLAVRVMNSCTSVSLHSLRRRRRR